MPEQSSVTVPPAGRVFVLRFDGRSHFLFWGPDKSGSDLFASSEGRLLGWDSPADLEREARDRGWGLDPIDEYDASNDVDLEPVQRWFRRVIHTVDPESALNLWNTATDVAYSLGVPMRDGGNLANRCYDKLVAANVPWLVERDSYVPRWNPHELKVMRRVLGEAVRVVRMGLR